MVCGCSKRGQHGEQMTPVCKPVGCEWTHEPSGSLWWEWVSRECQGHETHAVSNKPCGHSLVPSQPYALSPCPDGTYSQVVPVNSTDTHLHPGSEFPGHCEGLVLNQQGAATLCWGAHLSLAWCCRVGWRLGWIGSQKSTQICFFVGLCCNALFRRNLSLISYIAAFTKIGYSCETTKFTII